MYDFFPRLPTILASRFKVLAWVILATIGLGTTSSAATFTVDSAAYTSDAAVGDGICADGLGRCTLRAAIEEANVLLGPEIILLPSTNIVGGSNFTDDFTISDDVEIRGNGGSTIIDGGAGGRIFSIASSLNVTFSNFVIQNGNSSSGGGAINNRANLNLIDMEFRGNRAERGGAIFNIPPSILTITRCLFDGNSTSDGGQNLSPGDGAALYDASSNVTTIRESVFQNNTCGLYGDGGAVYVDMSFNQSTNAMNIDDSTFRNNKAGDSRGQPVTRPGGSGGGIFIDIGNVTMRRCTLTGNRAGDGLDNPTTSGDGGSGGAIYLDAGRLNMVNCTTSGNHAGAAGNSPDMASLPGIGGGLMVETARATITHCTFVGNHGGTPVFGAGGVGGGIYVNDYTLTIGHTLMDQNFDGDGNPDDLFQGSGAAVTSLGWNLIPAATWTPGGTTTGNKTVSANVQSLGPDPIGVDQGASWNVITKPLLHEINNQSAAYNCGNPSPSGIPVTDQRGAARVALGRLDIGAYEFTAKEIDLSVTNVLPACAPAGNLFNLLVTVANAGPSDADCLTVTTPLMYPLSFATNNHALCTNTGGLVICDLPNLPAGTSTNLSISVLVDSAASTGTLFTNAVSVAFGNCTGFIETNLANNAAQSTFNVCQVADVSISTTNQQVSYLTGETIEWEVVVTNPGPSAVTGAMVSGLPPPAGVTNLMWTCNGPGCSGVAGSGALSDLVNIPVGGAISYRVFGTVTTCGGVLTNSATITLPVDVITFAGNQVLSAEHSDLVFPSVDLSIQKTAPATVLLGQNSTFTLLVSNAGPCDAVNVLVTDPFDPAVFTPTSPISFTIPLIPAGGATQLFVNATLRDLGAGTVYCDLTNTASVMNDYVDIDLSNNQVAVPLNLQANADLSIALTAPPPTSGQNLATFEITLSNNGPTTASGMVVSNAIAPGLSFVGSNCGAIQQGAYVVWSPASLGGFQSSRCQLDFRALSCCMDQFVTNQVTVTFPSIVPNAPCLQTTDPTPGNNAATRLLRLLPSLQPIINSGPSLNLGCNSVPLIPPPAFSVSPVCGMITTNLMASQITNGCQVVLTRSFTAVDACGAVSVATQTLRWTELAATPPQVVLEPDAFLGCLSAPPPAPVLSVVSTCSVTNQGVRSVTSTNGCTVTLIRAGFAVDVCGQTGTTTQTLTWTVDTTPPIVSLGADVNLPCNSATPAAPALTIVDSCGVATSGVTSVQVTNGVQVILERIAFAVDFCGNAAMTTQRLTWVVDTTPPSIVLGQNTNLGCNAIPPPASFSATDVSGIVNTSITSVVTTNGCTVTMVRTAIATDGCGNLGTANQVLTWIHDVQPPVPVCPATPFSITLSPTQMITLTETAFVIPVVDGCGLVTTNPVSVTFTAADEGMQSIPLQFLDQCGNIATCAVMVMVAVTNTSPTLVLTNLSVIAGGTVTVVVVGNDPDLPVQSLAYSLVSGPSNATLNASGSFTWETSGVDVGTNSITIQVADGAGGLATSTFLVRVIPMPVIVDLVPDFNLGTWEIFWPSLAGVDYRLEWSPEIDAPIWSVVGSTTATGPMSSLPHATSPNQRMFYRVLLLP